MANKWQEFRLGDIAEWSSGGTPSKARDEYWGGNIPWISASTMEGNRYRDSKHKVTELGLKSGTRLAAKNSLLLLVRGSILHQKIQVGIAEKDVAFNQDVKSLKVKEDILDPWYLLFWFMSKESELLDLVESTGIGAGKLDTRILKDLKIYVPPPKEQNRILELAKALDDKIELNRKMNETLEAMAQAIFKSWFVDFDPVIDNALAAGNSIPEELQDRAAIREALGDERKPLPEDLRKRFPSEFELTEEMGWVPKGWELSQIKDCARVIKGKSYKSSELSESKTALVTLKSFNRGGGYRLDGLKEYTGTYKAGQEVLAGDLVIAFTDVTQAADVIGKPAMIVSDDRYNHLVISLDVAVVKPHDDTMKFFLYGIAKTSNFNDHTRSYVTGTTVLHLSKNAVPDYYFIRPCDSILKSYIELAIPTYRSIDNNVSEFRTLEKLRDSLLPKLISGELRIPDAEKLWEEVL